MANAWYLPYLINYREPVAEDIIIACVGFCTALLASAEGQGFVATLLGDSASGKDDRLHFNLFMHLSFWGTLCFLAAGFGWPKEMRIDAENFKKPRLYLLISRLAGPVANLLMANIAASICWILTRYGVQDKVFSTLAVVNVTMAVYSLIPLPPLPGAVLWQLLAGPGLAENAVWQNFRRLSPVFIIAVFLTLRLTGSDALSSVFNPVVSYLAGFVLGV